MTTPDSIDAQTPLLEVRGLEVSFSTGRGGFLEPTDSGSSRTRAVDGVNLTVQRGEILALAGESGCGKTTLARAIMGLQPAQVGQILLDGTPMGTSSKSLRRHRRRVQLIFQDPAAALDPRQTIYEAVAEGLRVQKATGDERTLVAEALSQAGLRPPARFFGKYPHEVSGGQRQRVLIAGALALKPDILVADEPVSALDASVRGEILRLLLKLRDELGLAIIIVTHDLGLAWMVANRVSVMYLGRIVETAPAEELLTKPQHPYTKALLSVVPESKHLEPMILIGETPDPSSIPPGCRFHPRCPLVVTGEAHELGIDGRCTSEDPHLRTIGGTRAVACFAPTAQSDPSTPTTMEDQ